MSRVVRAAVVVFIASFCTLVIEIVAGRVLAPYVGVSLYTWTSIIGVVLAGISAGAWAGGWLADRRPVDSTLGWLLLASGITAMLIAPATHFFASDGGVLTGYGIATTLLARVVVLAFLLFFLPSFFLGMISPVAVKMAVRDLDTTGRTVGKIYAFSTLGSIVGTFFTGFFLIARFGTRVTLLGTGAALIATALLLGGLFGRRGQAAAALGIALTLAFAGFWPGAAEPPLQQTLLDPTLTGVVHEEESQYYTIAVERTVREDTGAPLHSLHLDHLVHSYSDPADPTYLEYGYLRVFGDVVGWAAARRPVFRVLFIGGGGYTLPRYIEHAWPHAEVDVVEIDPAVTRVARRFFGIERDTSIRTFNEDARWFAMRGAGGPYDVIFIDAFNDLSVPYHLTTREMTASLRRLLAPGGALVANVIDDYQDGRFLASYVKTLEAVFGEGNAAMLMESSDDLRSRRSTFITVASASLPAIIAATSAPALPPPLLRRYLDERRAIVLTDDFAPVDNMLAPLFTDRFVDEQEE